MKAVTAIQRRATEALQNGEGFTLVEMAIALVIMAIIIGVILLGSRTTVNKSKVTASSSQLNSINGAVLSYEAQYNGYPTDLDGSAGDTAIENYLPAPPDSQYAYTCSTTNGVQLTYTASDAGEANDVLAEWVKQLGVGSATTTGAYIDATAPTVVIGNLYYGAVTCDTTD